MRTRTWTALGAAAAVLIGSSPAMATEASPSLVTTVYPLMVTKADAAKVGVTGSRLATFAVTSSDKGTPDAPWLCDLDGVAEVEGKGAPALVSMEIMSLKTGDVSSLSQELHVYASEAKAKSAYRGILKRIAECEGQHTPTPDGDADEPGTTTVTLTNGTKKASDGDTLLWVKSETTLADANGFASHEYLTVRHFGRYIQVVEVESEGTQAPPLTAKQMSTVDTLSDSHGDRLRAALT